MASGQKFPYREGGGLGGRSSAVAGLGDSWLRRGVRAAAGQCDSDDGDERPDHFPAPRKKGFHLHGHPGEVQGIA
jgi:hypothetical protein